MKIWLKIEEKLRSSLDPEHLEIIDESDKHKGHMGARAGGETHFAVTIVSEKFVGMSRMARHKLIYKILEEEMKNIHALSIKASA